MTTTHSFHRITQLTARVNHRPGNNWLELVAIDEDGASHEMTFFLNGTRPVAKRLDLITAAKIAQAINQAQGASEAEAASA